MYSIKNIFAAIVLITGLSVGAQAAETVKPLQGISLHTATKDAVAYFLAEKGACKVVLTVTDKAVYAPARFEQAVDPNKPSLRPLDDANALEFACAPEARSLSVTVLETVAQH
jgi:hypothetical protein